MASPPNTPPTDCESHLGVRSRPSPRSEDSPPRSSGRSGVFLSFILWQGAWLAVVVGAGRGAPLVGAGIAVAAIALSLALRGSLRSDLPFVLIAAVIGFAVDSALHLLGLLEFPDAARVGVSVTTATAPLWMALLWANLAAHCGPGSAFGWLAARPRLAATIGATSGPLAYFGGEKLDAIILVPPIATPLIALAILWGAAFPGLFLLRSALRTTGKDST